MEQITKKTTEPIQTKKKLYAACLSCGFVPFKSLNLINPNVTSIQHQVYRYVENGELEKYHTKDVCALYLTLETKNKIMNAEENTPLYYSKALKRFYANYTSKDVYRLRAQKLKLDRSTLIGLSEDDAKAKIKKHNSDAKQIKARKLRILRNGEAFLFFFGADFAALVDEKPFLGDIRHTSYSSMEAVFKKSTFYSFRELTQQEKGISSSEINIMNAVATNTKMNGIFITPDLNLGVYVFDKDVYKFFQESEMNAKSYISNIIAAPTGKTLDGCILLYKNELPIRKMIRRDDAKVSFSDDNLYKSYKEKNLFALPLSPEGQMIAKIMSSRFWIDRANDLSIPKKWQTQINQYAPFDGLQTETDKPPTYHLNFLVPDLGKLDRFLKFESTNSVNSSRYVIHCFDIQADLLKSSVKDSIVIHPIPLKDFYKAMM